MMSSTVNVPTLYDGCDPQYSHRNKNPKKRNEENDERQILAIPPSLSTLIHDQRTQIDKVDIILTRKRGKEYKT